MEAPAGGVDDMTKLSYLHEPGVLQNLKTRYELNEIYVCIPFTFTYYLLFSLPHPLLTYFLHSNLHIIISLLFLWHVRHTPEIFSLQSIRSRDCLISMTVTWCNNTREHPLENLALMYLLLLMSLTGYIYFALPPTYNSNYIVHMYGQLITPKLTEIGQWLMKEKAIPFWSVVKVEQVKLRPQKCLCGTLPFWVDGPLLKDGQLSNKFLKYDDIWVQLLLLKHLNGLNFLALHFPFCKTLTLLYLNAVQSSPRSIWEC